MSNKKVWTYRHILICPNLRDVSRKCLIEKVLMSFRRTIVLVAQIKTIIISE